MRKIGDILDRFFPASRWLALGVWIAAVLDFAGYWWHWEILLPTWGAIPSGLEKLITA